MFQFVGLIEKILYCWYNRENSLFRDEGVFFVKCCRYLVLMCKPFLKKSRDSPQTSFSRWIMCSTLWQVDLLHTSRMAFMCWQNFASRFFCSLKLHFVDTCCLSWYSISSPEQNFVVFCKNSAGTQFRGCVCRHGMVLLEKGSYSCCLNCSNNSDYWKRCR